MTTSASCVECESVKGENSAQSSLLFISAVDSTKLSVRWDRLSGRVRQYKQNAISAHSTTLLPASITASAAELGSHRTLLVLSLSNGLNLALPLDISVVPVGSRAEIELLQVSSPYRPKPSNVPSVTVSNLRVIHTDRPPNEQSAIELYTRKLEPSIIPTWLTGAYEKSRGKDPVEVVRALSDNLAARNHASRFHLLLWLEEWQMKCDIRMYDAHAAFSKRGDYCGLYGLSVPGLAEARPSVLVGDKILVSDLSIRSTDKVETRPAVCFLVACGEWRKPQCICASYRRRWV